MSKGMLLQGLVVATSVATNDSSYGNLAVGGAGAFNAGLYAAQILATADIDLQSRLVDWRASRSEDVLQHPDPRGSSA